MKILKFDEKIRFRKLFLYWIFFLSVGFAVLLLTTPLHPSFVETQEEITENFCQPINLIFVSIAFFFETLIFMFLPWKFFGKLGAIIGLSIWAILHLIGGSLPIFLYICVMAVFYFKCLEIGKFKSVFFFHFLINLLGILTCFF